MTVRMLGTITCYPWQNSNLGKTLAPPLVIALERENVASGLRESGGSNKDTVDQNLHGGSGLSPADVNLRCF